LIISLSPIFAKALNTALQYGFWPFCTLSSGGVLKWMQRGSNPKKNKNGGHSRMWRTFWKLREASWLQTVQHLSVMSKEVIEFSYGLEKIRQ
jgi:hypothetical protein